MSLENRPRDIFQKTVYNFLTYMQLTRSVFVQLPLASTLRCWVTASSASKRPGLRTYSLRSTHHHAAEHWEWIEWS